MSKSPTDTSSRDSLNDYRQGWRALNRLLHEERSFSGHEKNCAFLNMRNGRFASISSVAGLDFADDSRALGLCDWNFDGKLDLWITNRTAPRVRFLKNQIQHSGNFVAIQLRGNGITTNSDGVGARVEVITDNDQPRSDRSIQSLHAGDSFLTQSSRWLHFGLDESTNIASVRVHWPGGNIQSYAGVQPNGFYLLDQDSAVAEQWQPPTQRKELVAEVQEELPQTQVARIVMPYRLPLPKVATTKQSLDLNGPTLLTIWSATCPNCIQELTEWSSDRQQFASRQLNVVALNADFHDDKNIDHAISEVLNRIHFAFDNHRVTEESLRQLDYFQRSLMDLWQPMPVPCSFLLDRWQRVAVIYKGPVGTDQIIKDLELLDTNNFDSVRKNALPFAGTWGASPPQPNPMRVSSQFIDHRLLAESIDYLERYLQVSSAAGDDVSPQQQSDIHYVRSILLDAAGNRDAAFAALETCRQLNPQDYRVRKELAKRFLRKRDLASAELELAAAVEIDPKDLATRRDLATVLTQQNKFAEAANQLVALAKLTPRDAATHFNLGNTLMRTGADRRAIESYQRALQIRPDLLPAANNLAWTFATHRDPQLRDPGRAVELAEEFCRRTQHRNAKLLDTLSAAYAAAGRFEDAVKAIDAAIELTRQQANSDTSKLESRRRLYLDRKTMLSE